MTETLSSAPWLPTERGDRPLDPPAELLDRPPLSRMTFSDGTQGWLVTDYTLVRAVLADRRFSSRNELLKSPVREMLRNPDPAPPGMFVVHDPPEHTHYRRLLTGQFTVRRMNQLIPRIEQITAEQLDGMQETGPPADLVRMFALPIPSLVICELLGVPYGERELFQRESARLLSLNVTAAEREEAANTLQDYLLELVRAKRSQPDDALLSGLVQTDGLNDDERATMGLLLLVAGHETTANMLALGTFTLLTNPGQLARLRADPGMADTAVEELMRYLTILHIGAARAALEDVELGGAVIRAGEPVCLSLPAANRDPDRFPDPDVLDIGRPAAGHLSFGHGIHQCLGQQLARIEMRVGYTALFQRFPELRLAVPPGDVPMRHDMTIYGVHELPVTW